VPIDTSNGDVLNRSVGRGQRVSVDYLSWHSAARLWAIFENGGHVGWPSLGDRLAWQVTDADMTPASVADRGSQNATVSDHLAVWLVLPGCYRLVGNPHGACPLQARRRARWGPRPGRAGDLGERCTNWELALRGITRRREQGGS
jgi:hypothetical protein